MAGILTNKPANQISISCFGEVLWDCFGEDKRLGGAPLNVCWRLNALGLNAQLISSVGQDPLGEEILSLMKQNKVDTTLVHSHATKKTSEVQVTLSKSGSASYTIFEDCAWDNIELNNTMKQQVKAADCFVFGSLVGRADVSRATLNALLKEAKFKIFDVNLRAPYYDITRVIEWMEQADFIKLNDDELYLIAKHMGSPYHSLEQNLAFIAQQTDTHFLCVTKGCHGAVLRIGEQHYYNSGYLIDVVDTVGAGDGFLGSLIYQLCVQSNPQTAIDFACAVGALIAQHKGATPTLSLQEIQLFVDPTQSPANSEQ
ncbi:carbohydrate kinase family protein [Catenovulum sediminis]|uniref:Carbohydrate kinase n=1 Tax=Catenovulum sediminis TaxID=1740262 RepID=A0ABV1RCS4_9ALTE